MSAVVTRLPRNYWFQGEDRNFAFTVEAANSETPSSWTYELVVRRASDTCPGRDDPGDGAVVFTKDMDEITVNGSVVNVPILRADTLDLEPDDYYVALWRVDSGNERPLSILCYAHLTAVARQA